MASTVFLDSQNRLHREAAHGECPHCRAAAHFSLLACPGFARLRADRPQRVGMVFQCDACHAPLFFCYRVSAWREDRIEFHSRPEQPAPASGDFSDAHLPEKVAAAFREALACHDAGLMQAFAAMCRATTQAMLEDLGERSRLRLFDQVAEVRTLADLDDTTFHAIRRVLFDGDASRTRPAAPLTRPQAAVLLETMKDLLYQTYVRRAKLQQALTRHPLPQPVEGPPAAASETGAGKTRFTGR